MVYLTIFLSILISILVYSMDIVPSRQESDVHLGEPYILSFINQHQAAKDFVFHWMGNVDLSDSRYVKITKDGQTAGVLLPDKLDGSTTGIGSFFTPVGQAIDQDTSKSFAFSGGDGYFKSAYICLDKDRKHNNSMILAPCGIGKPYIITYEGRQQKRDKEYDLVRPDWWTDIKGKNRPIYLESWRRAIVKRTHGSYNCGFIQYAGDGKRWCYRTGEHDSISRKNSCDSGLNEKESKYCIDNGQGCKALLPDGVATVLVNNAKIKGGLDDVMVCISPVIPPYVRRGLVALYDGIDNRSAGAVRHVTNKAEWIGSIGSKISGGEWLTNSPAFKVAQKGVSMGSLNIGAAPEFTFTIIAQVGRNSPSTLLGPLTYVGTPDLAPGVSVGLAYLNGGCNSGKGEGEGYIHGAEDCFALLYRKANGTTAGFTKRYYERDEHTNQSKSYNNTVLSWTIVKKRIYDGSGNYVRTKLLWYGDGAPVCSDDTQPTKRFWAEWFSAAGAVSKIGGENATTSRPNVYAIRYYDRALSRKEIMQNFEADVKRYGLTRWDNMTYTNQYCDAGTPCPSGEKCVNNECVTSCNASSPCPFGECVNEVCVAVSGNVNSTYNLIQRPCETDCDMDDDCLSGTCINHVCTGYTQPEYITRR